MFKGEDALKSGNIIRKSYNNRIPILFGQEDIFLFLYNPINISSLWLYQITGTMGIIGTILIIRHRLSATIDLDN